MSSVDNSNFNKQNEILKKSISKMILKENTKGLSSHETILKRAAIKQFYQMNHQAHK